MVRLFSGLLKAENSVQTGCTQCGSRRTIALSLSSDRGLSGENDNDKIEEIPEENCIRAAMEIFAEVEE